MASTPARRVGTAAVLVTAASLLTAAGPGSAGASPATATRPVQCAAGSGQATMIRSASPAAPMAPCLTPTVPVITCTAGIPSLLELGTDGLAYTVTPDAPYRSGQTVTITARTVNGAPFGSAPTGWRELSANTLSYPVQMPRC